MIAVMNSATSSSISVKPRGRCAAMNQPPPEEPLPGTSGADVPAPELLPVSELPPLLVPGLTIAPVPPLLLLLLPLPAPLRLVPSQLGASPLAAATASPRNPITDASQFWSLPLLENLAMPEPTVPSEPLELDENPKP